MTWPVVAGLTRTMLKAYVWFSVLIVALFITIWVLLVRSDSLDQVIWSIAEVLPIKFFLLAMGGVLASTQLPVFIASGVTRREFLRGGLLFSALTSAAFALLVVSGYLVETAAVRLAGLAGTLDDPLPIGSVTDALLVVARSTTLNFGYLCAGWVVGAGIYRWGNLAGILAIPLLTVPILLAESLGSFAFVPNMRLTTRVEPDEHAMRIASLTTASTVLIVGLLTGLVILLIRRVPLRPRKA